MPQLFFRPKYVWFPVHLKGPMIPDPSGQLAELITSTRVDLYSHQILFACYFKWTYYILKQFNDAGRVMWLLTECEHSKLQMMFIFFQERYIHKDW